MKASVGQWTHEPLIRKSPKIPACGPGALDAGPVFYGCYGHLSFQPLEESKDPRIGVDFIRQVVVAEDFSQTVHGWILQF